MQGLLGKPGTQSEDRIEDETAEKEGLATKQVCEAAEAEEKGATSEPKRFASLATPVCEENMKGELGGGGGARGGTGQPGEFSGGHAQIRLHLRGEDGDTAGQERRHGDGHGGHGDKKDFLNGGREDRGSTLIGGWFAECRGGGWVLLRRAGHAGLHFSHVRHWERWHEG